MENLEGLRRFLAGNPRIRSFLLIGAVVLVAWLLLGNIFQALGFAALGVAVAAFMVATMVPRWFLIWFQYRMMIIEWVFAIIVSWIVGSSMAWSAVTFLMLTTGLVTVGKKVNILRKEAGEDRTWYEELSTGSLYHWISNTKYPLREDFVFDHGLTGFMDWRYLWWSLRKETPTLDFFRARESERETLPQQPKKGFWEGKSHFYTRVDAWVGEVGEIKSAKEKADKVSQLRSRIVDLSNTLGSYNPGSSEFTAVIRAIDALNQQIKEV